MNSLRPSDGPEPIGNYKRRFRNYLIDARFQLKYTTYIVVLALAISSFLGIFLWKTSQEVVSESQKVVEESRKVSDVVKISIHDDPVYGQNKELVNAFTNASNESLNSVIAYQEKLVRRQQATFYSLVGGLALMVTLIGLLGIYFTHKVAGPIYKMKRLLRHIAQGRLKFDGSLRRGDELQDMFESVSTMIQSLRERQKEEISQLDNVIEQARAEGINAQTLARIVAVRDEMKGALGD